SFLGGLFTPVCDINIVLNDADTRKTAEIKSEDGKIEKHYLFYDGESATGKCVVTLHLQPIPGYSVTVVGLVLNSGSSDVLSQYC
ncbi:hypothetical protein scyTo_0024307, partial [Scyliorhinus torazame]|nr:hypothetical protein [Scyliorhinus torazame]